MQDLRSAGRPATVGVAVLRQERRGLFELPGGVQQPVEAAVRLGEVQTPAPGAAHQSGHGVDQMADQRAQSVCPGRDGQ